MKRITFYLVLAIALAACGSNLSFDQIQSTVVAQVTASAKAETPYPTYTPLPTYTPYPTFTPVPKPTNTPRPTATPVPDTGTSTNPYNLGETVNMIQGGKLEFDLTVEEVIRGDQAWAIIKRANQFNDPAPDGMEYVIVKVLAEYTGKDQGTLALEKTDWKIVTNGRAIDYFDLPSVCCLTNEFDNIKILAGGKAEGIMAWPVAIDDQNPMLVIGMDSDGDGGVFFALAQ